MPNYVYDDTNMAKEILRTELQNMEVSLQRTVEGLRVQQEHVRILQKNITDIEKALEKI